MQTQTAPRIMDRRQHERFLLPPMYTPVTIRRARGLAIEVLDGHAYDISESGVRLEVDEPLETGEEVHARIEFPAGGGAFAAWAEVVRVYDAEDDPAARRAALHFRKFPSPVDRDCLVSQLIAGVLKRAA